ncbi:MAG: type II secretion system protein [Candidatus Omnitrophica bacterium]|nr:type II secretion system protein [Candidatus Omnitrophota bacterium]
MPRADGAKGFTLVEMMLAAGILAIIGLTIVSTFSGGMNIFYRIEGQTAAKTDVLVAMEKMERDLRDTFCYTGIDFIGSSRKMAFPGLIRAFNDKGLPEESLGSISYYLDDRMRKRALSREVKRYSYAVKKESSPPGDILPLAEIEDVNFKYYTYDPESESYNWASSWDKTEKIKKKKEEGVATGDVLLKDREENIPLGVKIEISYKENGRTITLNRAVFLPTAVSLNLAKIKAKSKTANATGAASEKK